MKFKELYKIEEPRQDGLVVPFRSVLAWFDGEFGGEFGREFGGEFGWFFGPFWHCPFRLVIAPEIAYFIGFFGNWPRF